MKKKYTKKELAFRKHGFDEQDRLRTIYDELVQKGQDNFPLTAAEQDHVWKGINFLRKDENKFPFADDARFKNLYLTYFKALDGGGVYFKARGVKKIVVSNLERDKDLAYLASSGEAWGEQIAPNMHPEPLMQVLSTEFRNDKRELDRNLNVQGNPLLKGTFMYEHMVLKMLLRSKFFYLMAKEIMEETAPDDYTYTFCGENIEFTEFTLIHILNRHFAETTKGYSSGKDYHPIDMKPRILTKQIKEFVEAIDNTRFFTQQLKTNINLQYKGVIYQLWAENKTKSVKGRGNITYKRLQSFFPVSSQEILNELHNHYRKELINEDLSVFVPM